MNGEYGNTPAFSSIGRAARYRNGRAETVFRIFEDPFLVAATLDRTLFKPWLIDNDRVIVRGVVIASLRERRAAA